MTVWKGCLFVCQYILKMFCFLNGYQWDHKLKRNEMAEQRHALNCSLQR